MNLLGILVGVLVMTLGAGSSWAGGSIKDAPAPVMGHACGGPFSGAYIGGQVGYIDHDAKFHDELGTGHVSGDDEGVTFGIYSGYNIQCGRLLYGIESDTNWGGTEAKWSDGCCQDLSSEMDWFGTVRGRLGLVHNDTWLLFVTGGLAYANFDYSFALGPPANFSEKDSETKFGWTIGGGVEVLRHANWSFKAEALYVDLGKEEINYEDATCGITCTARIGYEDEFWVARVGLSYHFGRREEVLAPLK